MKKLTTISLFIFFVVCTAILTAGLVFYQNNKNQGNNQNGVNSNIAQNDVSKLVASGVKVLDLAEIKKHNSQNDCWLLINGKVYDITSYFGKHPGGSGTMSATCGKDATDAYKTKDPYATTAGTSTAHSGRAQGLLANYYVGDLNQKIDQKTISQTVQNIKQSTATTVPTGGGDSEDD